MKPFCVIGLLVVGLASLPVWSQAADSFDPEQPFNQALTGTFLRSFLNQAWAVLEDHLEITGSLSPDETQGDRRGHLKFRFYPEGKSKSNESVTAEAWIDQTPDSSRGDFHFRFSLPKSPQQNAPSPFDHVL